MTEVTTEQKPEAGEVIEQPPCVWVVTDAQGSLIPWTRAEDEQRARDIMTEGDVVSCYVPAASLAAAEARVAELEDAFEELDDNAGEIEGQLASERAGRERLQEMLSRVHMWRGSGLPSGLWKDIAEELNGPAEPTPAPPSEGHASPVAEGEAQSEPSRIREERDYYREQYLKQVGQLRAQAAEREALLELEGKARLVVSSGSGQALMFLATLAKLDALRSQPTPTGEARVGLTGCPLPPGHDGPCQSPKKDSSHSDAVLRFPAERGVATDVAPVVENTGHLSSPVAPAAEGEKEAWWACQRCPGKRWCLRSSFVCRQCLGMHPRTAPLALPPPASPPAQPKCAYVACPNTPLPGSRRCYDHQPQRCQEPASDAGGESKFKPRCMVLVRGKHRCIKNDGHGPDNDLGDVVHIDAHGELFCEQGKLASPPSGQGPTEALTIGDVVYYQGQRSKVIGTEGYEGNIKRVCIEPAEYTGWVQADELAKGSK